MIRFIASGDIKVILFIIIYLVL